VVVHCTTCPSLNQCKLRPFCVLTVVFCVLCKRKTHREFNQTRSYRAKLALFFSSQRNTCVRLDLGNPKRAQTTPRALQSWGYTYGGSRTCFWTSWGPCCWGHQQVGGRRDRRESMQLLAAMRAPIWGRFVWRSLAMFVTCSYQCTLRILRWHLMWKTCNRAKSELVVVHVFEAYRSTGTTRDMHRRSLVVSVRCDPTPDVWHALHCTQSSVLYSKLSPSYIVAQCMSHRWNSADFQGLWNSPHPSPAAHPPWWSVLAGSNLCSESWSLTTKYTDQGTPCSSRWPQNSLDPYLE